MDADAHGQRVSGATPEAIALFDQALGEFNLYRGDPVATVDRALGAAPKFVMAHVLKAYLLGLDIEWTLTEAAVRGGLTDLAEALAHERLALKPHSPINRAFLERARQV